MSDIVKLTLPIFKPGQTVMHQGRYERVSHVLLRRGQMVVFLQGVSDPVAPEHLSLEPTELVYHRR